MLKLEKDRLIKYINHQWKFIQFLNKISNFDIRNSRTCTIWATVTLYHPGRGSHPQKISQFKTKKINLKKMEKKSTLSQRNSILKPTSKKSFHKHRYSLTICPTTAHHALCCICHRAEKLPTKGVMSTNTLKSSIRPIIRSIVEYYSGPP